jgi:hypothetical protein
LGAPRSPAPTFTSTQETTLVINIDIKPEDIEAATAIEDATDILTRRNAVLMAALRDVETWWLSEGMKNADGAPACIFSVRAALASDPHADDVIIKRSSGPL